MRLVTFSVAGQHRVGVQDAGAGEILDLATAKVGFKDMLSVIGAGEAGLDSIRSSLGACARLSQAEVRLEAPIPRPARNVFCVGKNYREHASEFASSGFDASNTGGSAIPDVPVVFTKLPSSVIGPGIPIPAWMDPEHSVDYEGELAVVIGIGGRAISRADAQRHIFGYTILNDVTARNWQRRHKQWFLGKSLDGFCPMGPAIVTADEIPDFNALELRTSVNGELRQRAKLSELIFGIPELIESISRGITLAPGDVIATGTPAGVGIGFDPPKFLKSGDAVTVEIDVLGELHNPVE